MGNYAIVNLSKWEQGDFSVEGRLKTAKMLGAVGYLSFLSIDVEFREDWAIRFLLSKGEARDLELFNPHQM